jgi:hypothetical protein
MHTRRKTQLRPIIYLPGIFYSTKENEFDSKILESASAVNTLAEVKPNSDAANTLAEVKPNGDSEKVLVEQDTTTALEETPPNEQDTIKFQANDHDTKTLAEPPPNECDAANTQAEPPPNESDATNTLAEPPPNESDATNTLAEPPPNESDATNTLADVKPNECDATNTLADPPAEAAKIKTTEDEAAPRTPPLGKPKTARAARPAVACRTMHKRHVKNKTLKKINFQT